MVFASPVRICWPERTKHRGHRQRLRHMNRPRCLETVKLGIPISRSRAQPASDEPAAGRDWPLIAFGPGVEGRTCLARAGRRAAARPRQRWDPADRLGRQ